MVHPHKVAAASTEANARLASAVDDVARKLDGAVQNIVGTMIDKLERDQLELLTAQVKSVHFAFEFDNDAMLGPAVSRIMELIAYAKNRITEGKQEWLGPWLMAESVRIIALSRLASSERAHALVQSEAHAFRLSILDYSAQSLVESGNVPWVKIAEFVQGKNEDVVHLISQSAEVNAPKQRTRIAKGAAAAKPTVEQTTVAKKSEEVAEPAAASAKTALNPAAAWPFPTGSR